ncbi:MAG: phospholipase [Deltaproteobacteria bacterium]|nr:phospholipase [Deltaproteobacteria bacterium]
MGRCTKIMARDVGRSSMRSGGSKPGWLKKADTVKPPWEPEHSLFFLAILLAVVLTAAFFFSPAHAGQSGSAESPSEGNLSAPVDAGGAETASTILRRETEEKKAADSAFAVTLYRQNYILFVTYDSDPNRETYEFANVDAPENFEVKFQLSLKILLWEKMFGNKNGNLYFGYTQRSFWQLYDKALSSPFRETNYEPEMFVRFNTDFTLLGLKHRFVSVGLNHQSNGRGRPLSRSWNRIYAEIVAERGNLVVSLKPWFRIPENERDDDNPDIEKYLGYGEVTAAYGLRGHVFSLLFRNNLRGRRNRGAVELGWSFPVTHNLRGYVQYFNGYGESLVDYNDASNRIGIGVMLSDYI